MRNQIRIYQHLGRLINMYVKTNFVCMYVEIVYSLFTESFTDQKTFQFVSFQVGSSKMYNGNGYMGCNGYVPCQVISYHQCFFVSSYIQFSLALISLSQYICFWDALIGFQHAIQQINEHQLLNSSTKSKILPSLRYKPIIQFEQKIIAPPIVDY